MRTVSPEDGMPLARVSEQALHGLEGQASQARASSELLDLWKYGTAMHTKVMSYKGRNTLHCSMVTEKFKPEGVACTGQTPFQRVAT